MKPDGSALEQMTADERGNWFPHPSPDGTTLAYCAQRISIFDIYTCSVEGGVEKRLTDGKGHADGPDYTPDGKWIWFNSNRSGSSQLWRMNSNGNALEQMTADERVNWFPHPSPNGAHVLYLAYQTGVDGHPRARGGPYRRGPEGPRPGRARDREDLTVRLTHR